jgi:hypothetical protein
MKVYFKVSEKYTPNSNEWINYIDIYDENEFEIEMKRSSMAEVPIRKESVQYTSEKLPTEISNEGDEDEEESEVRIPVVKSI